MNDWFLWTVRIATVLIIAAYWIGVAINRTPWWWQW